MTPQAYKRSHIQLMQQYVKGTTGDVLINSEYMGIGGRLYMKCTSCKTWCLLETEDNKNGSMVCNFCSKLKKTPVEYPF
jgi:hypothetical protein